MQQDFFCFGGSFFLDNNFSGFLGNISLLFLETGKILSLLRSYDGNFYYFPPK